MSNFTSQVFATAQECASEISKLRAEGVACRLQKVKNGFGIVLMNGKVQPRKAKVEPATSKVEPNKTVVKAQRESNFNMEEIMQDIHAEIRSLLKENEGLHEEDQIKVQDFDIAYRPVKGSSTLWKLFVSVEKAAVMLTYLNTHACTEDPNFPSAQVDVYEKGPANDLFVSLAVVILIEDGDIPDALHRKMIEKFR